MDDYISREAAINEIKEDAGCDFCGLKMATCCLSCNAGKKIIRIRQMPAADVRPVAEISDAVDEVLDYLNEYSNDMPYHIYSALFDLVSGICSSSGADMREGQNAEEET